MLTEILGVLTDGLLSDKKKSDKVQGDEQKLKKVTEQGLDEQTRADITLKDAGVKDEYINALKPALSKILGLDGREALGLRNVGPPISLPTQEEKEKEKEGPDSFKMYDEESSKYKKTILEDGNIRYDLPGGYMIAPPPKNKKSKEDGPAEGLERHFLPNGTGYMDLPIPTDKEKVDKEIAKKTKRYNLPNGTGYIEVDTSERKPLNLPLPKELPKKEVPKIQLTSLDDSQNNMSHKMYTDFISGLFNALPKLGAAVNDSADAKGNPEDTKSTDEENETTTKVDISLNNDMLEAVITDSLINSLTAPI